MTLTEEQRAAIEEAANICHEVTAFDVAAVLQAMIDSSGTVEPTGGFDLERARGLRDFLQDDCAEVGDVWGEMIAEIERLRIELEKMKFLKFLMQADDDVCIGCAIKLEQINELEADLAQSEICIRARMDVIDEQAARIKSLKKEIRRLKHESKVEQEFTNSYIKRLHDAEARIKELESSLDEAEALTKKNAELMNGYLRRIAELEDALVDELVKQQFWCGVIPSMDERKMVARQRLQAEGKIGPDASESHLRPYEVVAADLAGRLAEDRRKSWQITEERIGLLEYCLETLLDAPDIEEIPGPGHSIEMLRAMLREAEQ